jgi:hypothetical protein
MSAAIGVRSRARSPCAAPRRSPFMVGSTRTLAPQAAHFLAVPRRGRQTRRRRANSHEQPGPAPIESTSDRRFMVAAPRVPITSSLRRRREDDPVSPLQSAGHRHAQAGHRRLQPTHDRTGRFAAVKQRLTGGEQFGERGQVVGGEAHAGARSPRRGRAAAFARPYIKHGDHLPPGRDPAHAACGHNRMILT